MYRDVQPSPGRGAATSMLRSTLTSLVLLLSIGAGPQALAQDAPRSDVPPAVLTAPSSSAPPAVLSAVDNKPALATIPAGDSRESTGPTARRIGSLPSELSPWSMFLNADMVVKIVTIGLAFCVSCDLDDLAGEGLAACLGKTAGARCNSQAAARQKPCGWSTRGPVRMDAKRPCRNSRR